MGGLALRFVEAARQRNRSVRSAKEMPCSKTGTRVIASMPANWPTYCAATSSSPSTTDKRHPHAQGVVTHVPESNSAKRCAGISCRSRKHSATKILRGIPAIDPIRSALLVALIQTPHRFRTKRQLWAYSDFALETHDSAQYWFQGGQLLHSRKPQQIRGLKVPPRTRSRGVDHSVVFTSAC